MKLAVLPCMDSCHQSVLRRWHVELHCILCVYFKQLTHHYPQQPMASPVLYIYTKLASYLHEELLCTDSLHLAHKPRGGF